MSREANFGIELITKDLVLIRDYGPWDQYLTVTNDIENVIKRVAKSTNLTGKRVFYIDSDGDKTEVIVKNGEFVDFV